GWGIERDKRFSDRIEQRDPHLELWNLGVPGYGLDQQVLLYENLRATPADEVVLFVSPFTVNRDRDGYLYRKYKPRFQVGERDDLQLMPIPPNGGSTIDLLYRLLSPLYLPYFIDSHFLHGNPALQAKSSKILRSHFTRVEEGILARAAADARERHQRISLLLFLQPREAESVRRFAGPM